MKRLLALVSCTLLAACGGAPIDAPPERVGVATSAISVDEAVDAGCSTSQVAGLSLQIIAQANCNNPGAYAELPPTEGVSFGSAVLPYMQEPARDALSAALEGNSGEPMQINSMLRTVAQQYLLYQWFLAGTCGVALAATPGNSNHETGLAIDVQQYGAWQGALEAQGFTWFGSSDPVHFDYTGPGAIAYDGEDVLAFQQLHNFNNPDDTITEDGIYGPQTEARLTAAPAEGFPEGAECGDLPDGLTIDAQFSDADDLYDDGVSEGVVDLREGQTATLVVEIGGAALDDAALEVDLPPALELTAVDGSPAEGSVVDLGSIGMNESVSVELGLRAVASNVSSDDPDPIVLAITSLTEDVAVDVYEARAWRFESSRLEGWSSAGGTASLSTEAGDLVAEGDDELAVNSPALNVPSPTLGRIQLRASRDGGDGPASLWWTTDTDVSFDVARSTPIELPNDGTEADLSIDVSALGITGTLTGLRLVAYEDAPAGATLRLDELELVGGANPPGDGERAGDEGCGCTLAGRAPDDAPTWLFAALGLAALRRRRRLTAAPA